MYFIIVDHYQILTLNESLRNSRSISVRLQASQISRSLVHSSNRRLKATSNMDVFAMEQPQKFIGNEYLKSYNILNLKNNNYFN